MSQAVVDEDSKTRAIDDLDSLLQDCDVEKVEPAKPVQNENLPSREELVARLKQKTTASRQALIENKKKAKKIKSHPLTPVFYCDAPGCLNITTESPQKCSTCGCFVYCGRDCQVLDWPKHKKMCGKNVTADYVKRLEQYKEAWQAASAIFDKVKNGNYVTVIHEPGNVPACIFSSIAEKSNILHWKEYIRQPLFTTSNMSALGSISDKVERVMALYPTHKIFVISVILDRLREGQSTECIMRLFLADDYGETMKATSDGKISKKVIKYARK